MTMTFVGYTLDTDFNDDADGGGSGFKTARVVSDVDEIDPAEALTAIGLPAVDSVWSVSHPKVKLKNRAPSFASEVDRSFREFRVKLNYLTPAGASGQTAPNPTDRDWLISFDVNKETVVGELTKTTTTGAPAGDFDTPAGSAANNSAGDLFNPPPEIPKSTRYIRMSKNFTHAQWSVIGGEEYLEPYIDSMNEDLVTIASKVFAIWTGYCISITHNNATENGFDFIHVELLFEFDADLHLTQIRDAGFNDADGEILIEDSTGKTSGVAPTNPWPLNGAGVRVSRTDPDQDHFGRFGFLEQKDWSNLITKLSIPTTYP